MKVELISYKEARERLAAAGVRRRRKSKKGGATGEVKTPNVDTIEAMRAALEPPSTKDEFARAFADCGLRDIDFASLEAWSKDHAVWLKVLERLRQITESVETRRLMLDQGRKRVGDRTKKHGVTWDTKGRLDFGRLGEEEFLRRAVSNLQLACELAILAYEETITVEHRGLERSLPRLHKVLYLLTEYDITASSFAVSARGEKLALLMPDDAVAADGKPQSIRYVSAVRPRDLVNLVQDALLVGGNRRSRAGARAIAVRLVDRVLIASGYRSGKSRERIIARRAKISKAIL